MLFLEISQNSQENACARVSFSIKLQASATLLKKRLWHRCFPVNFVKLLRTPFLQNTSGRLLLRMDGIGGIIIRVCLFVCLFCFFVFVFSFRKESLILYWLYYANKKYVQMSMFHFDLLRWLLKRIIISCRECSKHFDPAFCLLVTIQNIW